MSRQRTTEVVVGEPLDLPFRPRARIHQLLGDELIGSPRLAVFELVKNAYDADAGMVRVALRNIGRPDASIVVEDDGDGMTLETIRDIWLVPGHDHRARQRTAGGAGFRSARRDSARSRPTSWEIASTWSLDSTHTRNASCR